MSVPKGCLDNKAVCDVTKNDLAASESEALTHLLRLHSEGKVRVVTSEVTRKETAVWKGANRPPAERVFYLLDKVEFIEDQILLGFHNHWDQTGGCSYPLIEEDSCSTELRQIGLDRADAHHVMLAIRNGCHYFVTCDAKSILKYRPAVEAMYPTIKLRKPSEVVVDLAAAGIK
jgi:hypothetical protein